MKSDPYYDEWRCEMAYANWQRGLEVLKLHLDDPQDSPDTMLRYIWRVLEQAAEESFTD